MGAWAQFSGHRIELLESLSQVLTIPLSALLNVEELTVTAKDAGGQEFERLLADLPALGTIRKLTPFKSNRG